MSIAQLTNQFGAYGGALTGVAALPDNFNYNGTDISPLFIYNGADATTSAWSEKNGGTGLTVQGGGGTALTIGSMSLGQFVQFNGDGNVDGEYFGAGDVNDIATADFIIEMIIKDGTAGGQIVSKAAATAGAGWNLRQNGGTEHRGRVEGDGTGRNLTGIATPSAGTWRYLVLGFDGNNGVANGIGVVYDSVADAIGASRSDFGIHTTVAGADNFTIGGFSSGGLQSDLGVARVAAYAQNSVIDLTSTTNFLAACRARVDAMGGTRGAALV